jgi:hypothetical protein
VLIADFEKKMAVHSTQLDDRKKGDYCPNRRARMQHQRCRDELIERLAGLQLNREVNRNPVEDRVAAPEQATSPSSAQAEGIAQTPLPLNGLFR